MKNKHFADQLSLLGEEGAFISNTQLNDKNSKLERMKELVTLLKEAAYTYEQEDREIMSNFEYDKLYDELLLLEKETGIILAGSVTQKAGFEVSSKLEKVKHSSKMLSLDKTKEVDKLKSFLGDKEGYLSWKLDGLTVVATYENGKLLNAVTRGNGEIGEKITNNFLQFVNVPSTISIQEKLVIRGEAVISYSTFEKINKELIDDEKYKNPRNLCSGSVRQLDPKITAKRDVEFFAFSVVEGLEEIDSKTEKLINLEKEGFSIVEYITVNKDTVSEAVKTFSERIQNYNIPSDGLVLAFDNIQYSKSLGTTSKFPKDAIAFKWKDEIMETQLIEIEWSPSRTGAINPVAIFNPIELEGTTVNRASLHNISIMEGLKLGIGDTITVFKANMIIPQVAENLTKSDSFNIPDKCPVCNQATKIIQSKETKVLHCTNKDCLAKHIGLIVHYVGRDAMNIEGLSEASFEKFMSQGLIHDLSSIYHLKEHKETIENLEGWGEKSFSNLVNAIEKSRVVDMPNFLYALGITQVGRTASKAICNHFEYNFNKIMNTSEEELTSIADIGPITAKELVSYMKEEKNISLINNLLKEITFKAAPIKEDTSTSPIKGLTFVVTGDVFSFKNRKELSAKIESLGGKVTGSVSAKTDYLINNDIDSTSGKNKKAKEVNEKAGKEVVKIINETQFLELINQ